MEEHKNPKEESRCKGKLLILQGSSNSNYTDIWTTPPKLIKELTENLSQFNIQDGEFLYPTSFNPIQTPSKDIFKLKKLECGFIVNPPYSESPRAEGFRPLREHVYFWVNKARIWRQHCILILPFRESKDWYIFIKHQPDICIFVLKHPLEFLRGYNLERKGKAPFLTVLCCIGFQKDESFIDNNSPEWIPNLMTPRLISEFHTKIMEVPSPSKLQIFLDKASSKVADREKSLPKNILASAFDPSFLGSLESTDFRADYSEKIYHNSLNESLNSHLTHASRKNKRPSQSMSFFRNIISKKGDTFRFWPKSELKVCEICGSRFHNSKTCFFREVSMQELNLHSRYDIEMYRFLGSYTAPSLPVIK